MEITRITSTKDKLFNPIWDIYTTSFPLCEQRTIDHQQTAFRSELYHLDCYTENDKIIGLLGYWDFPNYLYIEHFAINNALRGGGYGSRILESLLKSTDKFVIIEIDPQIDEISLRRLHFYERLGFKKTPFIHPLPIYQPQNHQDMDLTILTYPEAISEDFYNQFNNDLHDIVMKS